MKQVLKVPVNQVPRLFRITKIKMDGQKTISVDNNFTPG